MKENNSKLLLAIFEALNDNDVFRLVLKDERVDPSAKDNYAIRIASEKGYVEVVKLLLQDKRVDLSACDNEAMRLAARNNHNEVLELLCQYIKKN